MKILKQHEYEGTQIFIVHHNALFQYWFFREGNMYMQWGVHNPKWYRWILSIFGKPLIDSVELHAIVEAYKDHAIRSIDHLIDPKADHCVHNVVIAGKNAAKCTICSQKTEDEKTNEN